MSGLVEKVKEKVRSRSRHRKSGSLSNGRASGDYSRQDIADSRDSYDNNSSRPVHGTPAWQAHTGRASETDKSLPSLPRKTDGAYDNNQASTVSHHGSSGIGTEAVPARSSSIRDAARVSHDASRTNRVEPEVLPATGAQNDGLRRKEVPYNQLPTPLHNDGTGERGLTDAINNLSFEPNGSVSVHPRAQHESAVSDHHNHADPQLSEHVRLPQGFNLKNTETTEVSTHWRPAVTHETILRQRTEIIQEAITRDIHIHHYYTYLQPVEVVEVLPAKHFVIDEKTGQKVQIKAPAGWTLPANMQPRQPDYSMLKASTRHYLVDEEHPHGVLESPPLRHKGDREHLHNSGREVDGAMGHVGRAV